MENPQEQHVFVDHTRVGDKDVLYYLLRELETD